MASRDDAEFVEFVSACEQRLRRTAYLMLGDWQTASDVVQEALVQVYVAWPSLERNGGLPTYARRAVVSAVIGHRRRRWTREHITHIADRPDPASQSDEQSDESDLLIRALRTLPVRQRACIVLRQYEELSVAETADILNCSTGSVKSQTARGLDALRSALAHLGHGGMIPTADWDNR